MGSVVDLFAGPGGWDLAARELGLDPIGLEWDPAACATRRAAGLRTMECDVAAVDLEAGWKESGVTGLIASPPCTAFSMAGSGEGRGAVEELAAALVDMAEGETVSAERLDAVCGDPSAHLVLEPLRWALALRPEWIALEQVPPVLPLWEVMARLLRERGYSAWCGVLSAEQYGVPQTRKRAILVASRVVQVWRPAPTHQRYLPPVKVEADEAALGLFAVEPERRVHPEDVDLLPWVSMAQALGWDPMALVGFPRRNDLDTEAEYRERDLRAASQPAFNLTEKARSWTMRANAQANAAVRALDEPAPTITGGHDTGDRVWIADTGCTRGEGAVSPSSDRVRPADDAPAPCLTSRADQMEWRHPSYDSRGQRDGRTGEPNRMRSAEEPAPTIAGESRNDSWVPPTGQARNSGPGAARDPRPVDAPSYTVRAEGSGSHPSGVEWVHDRPATTVAGDPRIAEPGHKKDVDYPDAPGRTTNAVRVSVEEAAALQSFPADYPWQGTKTKQFQQIGNAIPPGLAYAVLREVISGGR